MIFNTIKARRIWLLGALLIASVAVVALWLGLRPSASTKQTNAELERRWLQGIPCAPPCWEGVTPGQTTLTETMSLLQRNPAIESQSVTLTPSSEPGKVPGYIQWRWLGSTEGGQIYFAELQGLAIVTDIWPGLAAIPGAQAEFTLGEIIDAYGEPTHIHAKGFKGLHGDGPFYTLSFYYEDRGIVLDHRGLYNSKPTLDGSIRLVLEGVSIEPVRPILPTFAAIRDDPSTGPQPWQGFQDFDVYCRNTSIGAKVGSKCP